MLSSLKREFNLLFQSDLFLVRISHTPTYCGCAAWAGGRKAAPFPACSQPFPALLLTTHWKAAVLVSFWCTKLWFSHRGSICHLTFELERAQQESTEQNWAWCNLRSQCLRKQSRHHAMAEPEQHSWARLAYRDGSGYAAMQK